MIRVSFNLSKAISISRGKRPYDSTIKRYLEITFYLLLSVKNFKGFTNHLIMDFKRLLKERVEGNFTFCCIVVGLFATRNSNGQSFSVHNKKDKIELN